jgi:hypothetical protein
MSLETVQVRQGIWEHKGTASFAKLTFRISEVPVQLAAAYSTSMEVQVCTWATAKPSASIFATGRNQVDGLGGPQQYRMYLT